MKSGLFAQLWNDDAGALLSMEFLFMATILVIGIIVGLVNVRAAINVELTELANAILALNLSFSFGGQSGCCAETEGSQAIDIPQTLPGPICIPAQIPVVITVNLPCN